VIDFTKWLFQVPRRPGRSLMELRDIFATDATKVTILRTCSSKAIAFFF
jgi:hypothetical protein